jgi:acetyl esterase/lipase
MRRIILAVAIGAGAYQMSSSSMSASSVGPGVRPGPASRTITRAALEDKIRGGWAGQMIGVSYGAPTEFRYNGVIIPKEKLPVWAPEKIENAIDQDDLYVEMTFAEVMDRVGLDATTEQYGDAFRDSKYNLWHANAAARKLLNRGIKAPWSGHPKYNAHANDIDFQIESDFIGLMTPGLPRESTKYCDRVGRVMNYGDGLYGGVFITAMYSAAFFESHPRRVVEQGLAALPRRSGYAEIISDLLLWSKENPDDWERTWRLLTQKWDRNDSCPGGALHPFNIDARLNGAFVALGLLFGKGDFSTTIDVSTRAGQDSDCNPSSAAGILGTMIGYARIPDTWKSGIAALRGRKFAYTNYSFDDITRSTVNRALKVVRSAGGSVGGDRITVPAQEPVPPALEQWDPGVPQRVIVSSDHAWSWKGAWTPTKGRVDRTELAGQEAREGGATGELTFTGSAVVLIGRHGQDGGLAELWLDGEKQPDLDTFIVERTSDQALWHAYGLKSGPHTLRIVTKGSPHPRGKGTRVTILGATTFSDPIRLWPKAAPGALGDAPDDVPTITPYLPGEAQRTGAAIIVCPGGGYGRLADHEGAPVAEWLNSLGAAAFVLKYRLGPRYKHPAPLNDAARAIRTIRARATDWGLDPARIGILGFSAGGHLAATAGTHFDAGRADAADPIDRVSSRPDAMVLVYPVITMSPPSTHTGSRRNLLGEKPSVELVNLLSNERQVTAKTPPTFLVHTVGDTGVPYENSLMFVTALRAAGVPHEFHLYERGRHGLGLGGDDPIFATWPARCADWLKLRGFAK